MEVEQDEELINHREKCRCCFKQLNDDKNIKGIDENVQIYFFELTQISVSLKNAWRLKFSSLFKLSKLILNLCLSFLKLFQFFLNFKIL